MKQQSIKKTKIACAVIAVIVLAITLAVVISLPKPLESLDTSFDLSQIADGSYSGYFDNGLVKVEVKVLVQNHLISNVELVEHQNGLGREAETIINAVVEQQSVEVDAISGATASSQTILKAIESALSKGQVKS